MTFIPVGKVAYLGHRYCWHCMVVWHLGIVWFYMTVCHLFCVDAYRSHLGSDEEMSMYEIVSDKQAINKLYGAFYIKSFCIQHTSLKYYTQL